MSEKNNWGGLEKSTERAKKIKAELIKTIAPVIAECYRTMTEEEFEDVCAAMSKYFEIARILIPLTGVDTFEQEFKNIDQES